MHALVWSKPHPKQHGNSSIIRTYTCESFNNHNIYKCTHSYIPTFSKPILNYEKKSIKFYRTFEGGQVAF
jgi:hypothetical protein